MDSATLVAVGCGEELAVVLVQKLRLMDVISIEDLQFAQQNMMLGDFEDSERLVLNRLTKKTAYEDKNSLAQYSEVLGTMSPDVAPSPALFGKITQSFSDQDLSSWPGVIKDFMSFKQCIVALHLLKIVSGERLRVCLLELSSFAMSENSKVVPLLMWRMQQTIKRSVSVCSSTAIFMTNCAPVLDAWLASTSLSNEISSINVELKIQSLESKVWALESKIKEVKTAANERRQSWISDGVNDAKKHRASLQKQQCFNGKACKNGNCPYAHDLTQKEGQEQKDKMLLAKQTA